MVDDGLHPLHRQLLPKCVSLQDLLALWHLRESPATDTPSDNV